MLLDHKQPAKLTIILISFIFILGALWLFSVYNPIANDDAYIYYNYARNMAEGRFFAHDARNMPTEGFTSILYLLLLTPFEFFKINVMFGAFLINFIGLVGVCFVVYRLLQINNLLPPIPALLGASLVWLMVTNDTAIKISIEIGLETILGSLIILSAIMVFALIHSRSDNRGFINQFFILLFLGYIVRPESIAFLSAFALPILLIKPKNRRQTFRNIVLFTVIFVGYHAVKYLIFGDVLPTSFYRKVNSSVVGPAYVAIWLRDYLDVIQFLGVLLVGYLVFSKRQLFKQMWFWFMLWIVFISMMFFGMTTPLAGGGHRFFATSILIFYILIVATGLLLLEKLPAKFKQIYPVVISVGVLAFIGVSFLRLETGLSLNIYQKAETTVDDFVYLRLGYHLREALSDPDDVTLVFGDAGALPYALGGTFIDLNGLTEPKIAKMFKQPDDAEKIADYVDYILSFEPDIVILAWGSVPDDGVWVTPVNNHSPFQVPVPMELFEAYREQQVVYVCSLPDLFHIGLRRTSSHYAELKPALSSFCDDNGYVIEGGLTILSPYGGSVHFPVDDF